MSQFRSKILDLGGFVNIRNIRDHTKRKVFEQNEVERYVYNPRATVSCLDVSVPFSTNTDRFHQTSTSIHDQKYHTPPAYPRASTTPTFANALLHPSYANQEQMYSRRQGKRCIQGFQNGQSTCHWELDTVGWTNDFLVSIQDARARRRITGCDKGFVVNGRQREMYDYQATRCIERRL